MIDDNIDQMAELDAIASSAADLDPKTPEQLQAELEQTELAEQRAAMPETSEILFPVINSVFSILAPNWGVTANESQALAEAYGALIDKYFPDSHMAFGAEITAVTVTAMVVAPRIGKARKKEEKEVNKKQEKREQPAPSFEYQAAPEVINLD